MILGGVLTLFGGVILCNNSYASAEFSIDVSAAALQLTVPENVNIVLQPTSSAAVFDSRNLTFNVATNNPTGYVVTMSVPQTAMPHSSLASTTLPTLEFPTTEANFPANKWGYKTTGDYNPVALTNNDPAWNGEGATNGTDHIITLAAKVDGAQPAGVYTNTLTFNAVANPNLPKDTIVFNANDVNATGTMTNQTVYQGSSITLSQNTFVLEGYTFEGWNTAADGSGTTYVDGASYTPDPNAATTKTVNLYAQWEQIPAVGSVKRAFLDEGKSKVTINGSKYYKIQDMTTAICDLIDEDEDGQLVDERDGTIYNIGKSIDGRCWMLDNLALDIANATVQANLSSTNTNASGESIGHLINGGGTTSDQYAIHGVAYWGRYDYYSDPLIYADLKNSVNTSDPFEVARTWKFGIYYNYCAASAGSYCWGNGESAQSQNKGDATEDICPAGWRMATSSEWQNLGTVSSSQTRIILHMPATGYYQNRIIDPQFGFSWESTASPSASNMNNYAFHYSSTSGNHVNSSIRRMGLSVRCIAK